MDLAALLSGGEYGTNRCHMGVFNEDVAFVCHFVAPRPPPTLPPYRSGSGIDYTSKKLSKMDRQFS